jgi:hypothetical protein
MNRGKIVLHVLKILTGQAKNVLSAHSLNLMGISLFTVLQDPATVHGCYRKWEFHQIWGIRCRRGTPRAVTICSWP